ncbi:MAG TPA: hypothetical protein VN669_02760 [Candidatus Acidoferrales bacterium]|nr:hypothetical protein [Candidatus Acidoferrales bacterium]
MKKHTAHVDHVRPARPAVKNKSRKNHGHHKASAQPDRLITQLEDTEAALQKWIKSSPGNSEYFRRDPIRAMRAAGLEIDDDIMLELELITSAIARKLK